MSENSDVIKLRVDEKRNVLCPTCSGIMERGFTDSGLVGYSSPAGHSHDDNCLRSQYVCQNNNKHTLVLSVIRKCSNKACDWKGKTKCFCHPFYKLACWPENTSKVPAKIDLIPYKEQSKGDIVDPNTVDAPFSKYNIASTVANS